MPSLILGLMAGGGTDFPHSNPSLCALPSSAHSDVSEGPFTQQMPAGQNLQFTPLPHLRPDHTSYDGWRAQGHRTFQKRLDSEVLAGEEGEERPSPRPLGGGAAPGPRAELSRSAGKGLGLATSPGRRERRRTLSFGVSLTGTVRPIPGISQVTLSRGSLDAPNSRDPIPDFKSSRPFKSEPGFRPGLQILGTGPLNGLWISGS